MGRTPCCDKSKVKRGTWSLEEDATLKNYIAKHGPTGNWISLPHKAGLRRCGKSCRLRWLNYLRPNIKHGGFTQEEEDTICNLYTKIGSRWSVIAAQLEGRTDNEVKNYWNTKLKKKLMRPDTTNPPATGNTEIATASSTTTTATVANIFQASTSSPSFSDPFTLDESFSSVVSYEPKLVLENGSSDFSSANPHQELSSFMRPFGFEMDGSYGGNWNSVDEGFGDYSNAGDLFSIFQR